MFGVAASEGGRVKRSSLGFGQRPKPECAATQTAGQHGLIHALRVPKRRLITLPTLRRGYTLEVTPVPIPNTAVKLQRADDTAFLSVEK